MMQVTLTLQSWWSERSDSAHSAQIHWFSIINSCVTVLLLTGFLATILMRVLKNDFVKYTRDDDGGYPCPGAGITNAASVLNQAGAHLPHCEVCTVTGLTRRKQLPSSPSRNTHHHRAKPVCLLSSGLLLTA